MKVKGPSSSIRVLLWVVVCIAILGIDEARSQDGILSRRDWDQPAFGIYGSGQSWDQGDAPDSDDLAIFGSSLTTVNQQVTVQLLTDQQVGSAWFASGDYELRFGNPGTTYTVNDRVLIGGGTLEFFDGSGFSVPDYLPNHASLLVSIPEFSSAGTIETRELVIGGSLFDGEPNPTSGSLILDGAGTLWVSTDFVAIGTDGNSGSLTVRNGAQFHHDFASYYFNIGGSPSFRPPRETGYGEVLITGEGSHLDLDNGFRLSHGQLLFDDMATGEVTGLAGGIGRDSLLRISNDAHVYIGRLQPESSSSEDFNSKIEVVDGGFLEVGNLLLDSNIQLDVSDGGLTIYDRASVNNTRIEMNNGSSFRSYGDLESYRSQLIFESVDSFLADQIDLEESSLSLQDGEFEVSNNFHVASSNVYVDQAELIIGGGLILSQGEESEDQSSLMLNSLGSGTGVNSNVIQAGYLLVESGELSAERSTIELTGEGHSSIENGRLTLDASNFTNQGLLIVGDASGTANLEISNGTVMRSLGGALSETGTSSVIGRGDSSGENANFGSVIVSGASTWEQDGYVEVGSQVGGEGYLEISADSRLATAGGRIGRDVGSSGKVKLGGLWTSLDSIYVGGDENGRGGFGSLQLDGGNLVIPVDHGDEMLVIRESGLLYGNGTIDANVLNAGTLSVGSSYGAIEILGDFELSESGLVSLEFGGLDVSQQDQLRVTGNVSLAGSFELLFVDGFLPLQDDQFTLIESLSGAQIDYSNLAILTPTLRSGFEFDLVVEDGSLRLIALSDGAHVPEPSLLATCSLVAVVFGGYSIRRRRKMAKAAQDDGSVAV